MCRMNIVCIQSKSLTPLPFVWVKKVSRCKNQKNAATALWFIKNIWRSSAQHENWKSRQCRIPMFFFVVLVPSLRTLKCQFAAINTCTIFSEYKTEKQNPPGDSCVILETTPRHSRILHDIPNSQTFDGSRDRFSGWMPISNFCRIVSATSFDKLKH